MRRLAYLSTSSGVGGAERQVHDLALAMAKLGWDVSVVSMLEPGGSYEDLPSEGVDVHTLGMRRGIPDPRAVLRLRSLIAQSQPDVLHAHMVHANLLARIVHGLDRKPFVISTMHSQRQGPRWRYLAYRLTDRLSDLTTAVSQAAMDEAIRLGAAPSDRIQVVPNGIDASAYHPDPLRRDRVRSALGLGNGFVWLAVGRLAEPKDYPTMIDAFSAVIQRQPYAQLLVAGEGPLEASLRQRIHAAELESKVTLLGLRGDIPNLMQAADGYVMSSAWEGLPMVLLEAAASALPIVTTDVGGARDVVIDGVSGVITARGHSAELSAAMLRIATMTPNARRDMGTLARTHVSEKFGLDAIVQRWHGIYEAGRASRSTK